MVRTVKDMFNKNATTRQLYDALLAYRATALRHCRYSTAELLMGRKVKTPPDAVNHDAFQAADAQQKAKSTRQYDLRHRTRDLPPQVPGDTVTSAAGPFGGEGNSDRSCSRAEVTRHPNAVRSCCSTQPPPPAKAF